MALTPGSASLHQTKALVRLMHISQEDMQSSGDTVLKGDTLFVADDASGNQFLYLTKDGVPLNQLKPIINLAAQPISPAAQEALESPFSGGTYQATPNGVVVADGEGKVSDNQLHLVDNGHLVLSYLDRLVDPASETIRPTALPDVASLKPIYVRDISARNEIPVESRSTLVVVMDASADPTVDSGGATYIWLNENNIGVYNLDVPATFSEDGGFWYKLSEQESLDVPQVAVDNESVANAGAVMYDHMLLIEAPTLSEYIAKAEYEEPEPDAETMTMSVGQDTVTGNEGADTALGLSFSGTYSAPFKVTITPTSCQLSKFISRDQISSEAYEYTGTLTAVNKEIAEAKIVFGDSAGTVEITCDATVEPAIEAKTITVTGSPAEPIVIGGEDTVSGNQGTMVPLGTTLTGTTLKDVTITITPTDCELANITSRPSPSEEVYTKTGTIDEINGDIESISVVVGDVSGSVLIQVTGSDDKTVTVTKTE